MLIFQEQLKSIVYLGDVMYVTTLFRFQVNENQGSPSFVQNDYSQVSISTTILYIVYNINYFYTHVLLPLIINLHVLLESNVLNKDGYF